jgi:hypothetical protein
MKMTNTTKFVALALLLGGTLLTVSVAYAASITMSTTSVMALGGTGQVTLNCPATPCSISSLTWGITGPPTAAPTVNQAVVTMTLAGTSSNHYTVYVTLFGSGATVLTSASQANVAGASTSATVTISGSISPSAIVSVEVDVVQTN